MEIINSSAVEDGKWEFILQELLVIKIDCFIYCIGIYNNKQDINNIEK